MIQIIAWIVFIIIIYGFVHDKMAKEDNNAKKIRELECAISTNELVSLTKYEEQKVQENIINTINIFIENIVNITKDEFLYDKDALEVKELFNPNENKVYSGDIFIEGEILNINGCGKYYYNNGKVMYEGEIKDMLPNGKGKLYYNDGKLAYEGNFISCKPEGEGSFFTYANEGSSRYNTAFKDGTLQDFQFDEAYDYLYGEY